MAERVIPHSDEAERSVLGASMLDERALIEVAEKIKPEDFYKKNHQEIFAAMMQLHRQNAPVDSLTVSEELSKRGVLEMVGGRAYVAGLASDVPSIANASEYASIVAEKALLRNLIIVSDDVMSKSYADDTEAEKMLDYAEQQIMDIARKRQSRSVVALSDILLDNMEMINERSKTKGQITGVPTGLTDLDRKTSGLQKSDLIILAARPSMGKTAFALCVAKNAAAKGNKVMIFSLEMSKEQLTQRLLAMEAMVDSDKMRKGDLNTEDWKALSKAADSLDKAKIFIDDTPGMPLMEMKNKCRRLKEKEGLDLVIVDYLQLMEMGGRVESRQLEIAALSRQMKQMARELECPVIALSQLSRASEQRKDNRPILSDLRDSGAIEQDADVVLFLYRDEVYNPETEKPGECEVNVAKQRNGPIGVVEVRWLAPYTKFVNKMQGDF
ncbi:MAG: replicative DNA helicase [Anaerovoracaceae bacterium]|jgi:replicative DNA helicase|nr:replicative DNA helicase [Anaerovoracaceae bacterium]